MDFPDELKAAFSSLKSVMFTLNSMHVVYLLRIPKDHKF